MTDKINADHVYLKPLEKKYIREILEKHHIDAVLPTVGGQTALNLCIECEKAGIWQHFGVRIIGVDIEAIETTENREKFRLKMNELGVGVCKGATATSFLEGKEIAQEIGFPLVIRPSYTLGGTGGGFVEKPEDFKRGDDIDKGIVKWLVEMIDETNEVTGVATILTMVAKKGN